MTNGERGRPPVRVRIVHLTAPVFRALADGDLAAANGLSPVPMSPYFAGPDWRGVWQRRLRQAEADPATAAWVTGVIWDEDNLASYRLVAQYGFVQVGAQWDDEDGEEIIYERP